MFLTRDQIRQLTGKKTRSAQARELTKLGIEYAPRSNGAPVVMEAAVLKRMSLENGSTGGFDKVRDEY